MLPAGPHSTCIQILRGGIRTQRNSSSSNSSPAQISQLTRDLTILRPPPDEPGFQDRSLRHSHQRRSCRRLKPAGKGSLVLSDSASERPTPSSNAARLPADTHYTYLEGSRMFRQTSFLHPNHGFISFFRMVERNKKCFALDCSQPI